jgi:hypothetical protein
MRGLMIKSLYKTWAISVVAEVLRFFLEKLMFSKAGVISGFDTLPDVEEGG